MSGIKDINRIQAIDREPWVELLDGRELENWSREDEIVYNQRNRQSEKLAFYVQAFDFLNANRVVGDYHEYGCHRGRTFRMALTEARRHNLQEMRFFAFDSFSGLPQILSSPDVPLWHEGALSTSEEDFWSLIRTHGIYVDRCETIKGFYRDTLTPTLQQKFNESDRKIAFACMDCDLYESAAPVFQFIEPLIQEGSLIYIDEMFDGYKGSPVKGVPKAFHEFEERSRFKYVPHMQVGWWGRSYIAYLE